MASRKSTPLEMVLSVLVVCAVSAAGLAMTYSVTKDRIAEQERAARDEALKKSVPGATDFVALDDTELESAKEAAGEVLVYGVYSARSDAGDVGWGIEVGPRGYGGPIKMVVGLDRNGKVTGANIVSMNETPGLGTQIVDDKTFLKKFLGVNSETAEADVKKLDMITGATKSSRGARHGIEAAAKVYVALVESGAVSR